MSAHNGPRRAEAARPEGQRPRLAPRPQLCPSAAGGGRGAVSGGRAGLWRGVGEGDGRGQK